MKKGKGVVWAAVAALGFAAVAAYFAFGSAGAGSSSSRWYAAAQVAGGEKVFEKNCLVCHGEGAQGTGEWRRRLPDGSFLPPPLNGSAHAWHHPLTALKQTIKQGGAQVGGNMPAFENTLSDEEIEQVIAYFQSQWPDEIYRVWEEKVNSRH